MAGIVEAALGEAVKFGLEVIDKIITTEGSTRAGVVNFVGLLFLFALTFSHLFLMLVLDLVTRGVCAVFSLVAPSPPFARHHAESPPLLKVFFVLAGFLMLCTFFIGHVESKAKQTEPAQGALRQSK